MTEVRDLMAELQASLGMPRSPGSPTAAVAVESRVHLLAEELVALKADRKDLDLKIQEVEDALVDAMAEDRQWEVEVPGIGVIKRHGGKKRSTWRHEDLWRAVTTYARNHRKVDEETGELEAEWESVSRNLRAAAAPSYWRKTALAPMTIDPDEYCSTTVGRQTIEVVA